MKRNKVSIILSILLATVISKASSEDLDDTKYNTNPVQAIASVPSALFGGHPFDSAQDRQKRADNNKKKNKSTKKTRRQEKKTKAEKNKMPRKKIHLQNQVQNQKSNKTTRSNQTQNLMTLHTMPTLFKQ